MSSQRGGEGGGGGGVGGNGADITPPLSPPMPGRVMGGRNGYIATNNNMNNMNTNDNRDMHNNNENAMLSASTSQVFHHQQQQRDGGRSSNGGSSGLNNMQENKQQLQIYGGGGSLVVAGGNGDTCPWYLQTKEAHESIATAREDGNWTSLGTSTLGSALTPRSSRSHARHGHAAYAIGNKMIVIGGNTAGTVRSDVIALDCKTLQWEQVECICVQPGANSGECPARREACCQPPLGML